MMKNRKRDNYMSLKILIGGLFILVFGFGCQMDQSRPNIILIMGDDIGFSDIGAYGSEIKTPNLDLLAQEGIRFSTFYNMSKCNPTRSSLLTGLYKGGEGAVSMAGLLKQNGYQTMMSGKEHFDEWVPEYCRVEENFDERFYFWINTEFFIPPDGVFDNPFIYNGKELTVDEIDYEREPFFKTDVFVDYALRWLNEKENDPFFLYLPFHAAHYPLQARPEDIEKYIDIYKQGWDQLRDKRYGRLLEMGLIPEKAKLSTPTDNIHQRRRGVQEGTSKGDLIPKYRPWDSLTDIEKEELGLEMAVFAAMVDRMDQNIGRVIDWLKEHNELDNTIILYLSDNGSCPYDSNVDLSVPPGPAHSYRTLSAAWANLGNTPFRYFKQFGHEGGSHTQLIVHWPEGIEARGEITDQPGHVVDIFPTILDIAGINYPQTYQGYPSIELHGSSLLPVLQGEQREEPGFFISGNGEPFRMFRKGKWKIVRANNDSWELYDLEEDPTETKDLAFQMPEVLSRMEQSYLLAKEQLNWKN